jgi:ketosteroid isomerase-like protein
VNTMIPSSMAMRSLLAATLLLLIPVFAFSQKQTDKEDQKITHQIIAMTRKYNAAWDTLDMNKVAEFHSNKTFRYFRHGSLAVGSNEEFRMVAPEWMKETKTLTAIEFNDPIVQVLSKDTAMIGFKGVAKVVLKDGKEELESGAATYLWQKIGKEWKIVNIHESKK